MGSIDPSTTQHHGDLTTSRSSTPDSQATVTERPSSEASEKETPEHQASDPIDSRPITEIYHTAAYMRHQIDELHPADQDMVHEYQASESHRVYAAYDIGNDAEGTSYIPNPQDEYFHYNGLCRLPRKIDYMALGWYPAYPAYPGPAVGNTRERGYHGEDYEFYAVAPEHFRHLTRCTHAYNAIVGEMEKQRRQSVGFVGRSLGVPDLQGQQEGRGERHGQPLGQYQNQWQYLQHQQHQQHQQQQRQHNHRRQQQQQQTPHHVPPQAPHPQQPQPQPQHPVHPRPPHHLQHLQHLQHRQPPQQPQRTAHPVQRPIPPPQHLSAPPPHLPHRQIPPQLPPQLGPWHGMTRSEKKRAKNKKKRLAQAARKRAQYATSPPLDSRQGKQGKRYSATHWPDADVWAEEMRAYEGVVLEVFGGGGSDEVYGDGGSDEGGGDGEGDGEGNRADSVAQDPQQEPQQQPQAKTNTDPNPKYPTIAQYQAALLTAKASLGLTRDGQDCGGVGQISTPLLRAAHAEIRGLGFDGFD